MSWPTPLPGLVIRYSYLWVREAQDGRDEGVKDRPCAVILAHQDAADESRVYVLPVTHSRPARDEDAIEIPLPTKARLKLDGARSWVVITEANVFAWPGPVTFVTFPPEAQAASLTASCPRASSQASVTALLQRAGPAKPNLLKDQNRQLLEIAG